MTSTMMTGSAITGVDRSTALQVTTTSGTAPRTAASVSRSGTCRRTSHQEVGADAATLVWGEDRFGHFELEPAPAHDLAPEAVACHRRVHDRRLAILMRGAAQSSKAGHTATAM
jgi:hypothetical protein